jgi:hypothetical protein
MKNLDQMSTTAPKFNQGETVIIVIGLILGCWFMMKMVDNRVASARTDQFLKDNPQVDAWMKAEARRDVARERNRR